jgi:HAD superfamily hydrolase (TIGR01490 family)
VPVAAFFDLDKTLIDTSVAFAYVRPLVAAGLLSRRAVLSSLRHRLAYKLVGAGTDRLNALRDQAARLVQGWPVARVAALADRHADEILAGHAFPGARALLDGHRDAGHHLVLASTSPLPLVRALADRLGVRDVVASDFEVVDGCYRGGVALYAEGDAKAKALAELADRRCLDLAGGYAYSDSVSDLPMLRMVGHPVAVHPDRALRRTATTERWPIRSLR